MHGMEEEKGPASKKKCLRRRRRLERHEYADGGQALDFHGQDKINRKWEGIM